MIPTYQKPFLIPVYPISDRFKSLFFIPNSLFLLLWLHLFPAGLLTGLESCISGLVSTEGLIRIRIIKTNQLQSSILFSFDCNREILDIL